jgi:hypothetical protein
VPIKTTITADVDVEKFKQSYALLQRYQTALKELYGSNVSKAPHIKAVSVASADVLKFLDLDKAARSQTKFAASAQKAGSSFKGLASGVVRTLEGFARVALSPLQILFPAGLVVGLAGIGAGLAGLGIAGAGLYGLDREAADVSDRRRRALGLGVSYGSLSAYDLNFQRFGVGEGTLGAVAGGIYDVTSPEYLGLLSSGATGHGDTSEAAIDLIRRIPDILKGVPDGVVGSVARSRNLTSLLDLPTIIRLRSHPEEIEAQVKRYQQDRKTLDISKDAQEKWSAFNAAIERAGLDIETVLGKNLVALTPGLTKFSDDVVTLIGAFIDSGTVTDALKGIEGGLQWLDGAIGSTTFKHGAKRFLSGLETLGPYIAHFVDYAAQVIRVSGRGAYYGAKLAGDPSYNPNLPTFLGDLAGQRQPSKGVPPPGAAYNRLPSIRYFAGHGKERPAYPSGVIDSATGKLLPGPGFRYSPGYNPTTGAPSAVKSENGNVVIPAVTDQNRSYRNTGTITLPGADGKLHAYSFVTGGGGRGSAPTGDYDVGEFATGGAIGDRWTLTGVGQPHDTAFDPVLNADRSALRIHMAHGDRTLGCIGILGGDQVFADFENNLMYVIKKNGGHVRLRLGSPDAVSITNRMTPTAIGAAAVKNKALPSRPVTPTPVHHWGPWHADGWAGGPIISEPMQLPGSKPAQAVGEDLGFDNNVGIRNRALRNRGRALHILDHIDKSAPPGPIVIHDMTGGSAQVTVSRHEAAF